MMDGTVFGLTLSGRGGVCCPENYGEKHAITLYWFNSMDDSYYITDTVIIIIATVSTAPYD